MIGRLGCEFIFVCRVLAFCWGVLALVLLSFLLLILLFAFRSILFIDIFSFSDSVKMWEIC